MSECWCVRAGDYIRRDALCDPDREGIVILRVGRVGHASFPSKNRQLTWFSSFFISSYFTPTILHLFVPKNRRHSPNYLSQR